MPRTLGIFSRPFKVKRDPSDGKLVFRHACKLGLEGIVSKRIDMPYRSGRTKSWIKVKNPKSPAMLRIQDGTW